MGSSDLARYSYSYDDTCCNLNDFSLDADADVLALTKQAKALNPNLKIMATPWSAPAWMKDNRSWSQGWLQAQYYGLYGQYFAKYVQGYQAQGLHVDYVSPQNEPTCCAGYPSMSWNTSGLRNFITNALYPAFRGAGITTKVLVHDWNWDGYDTWAAPLLADGTIRNDPLFGGIAWHGYGGNVCTQTTVHNGDGRSGQVDYTIEYYTMGHLTKFVKPSAVRIDSTANSSVPNVAWKNPDGSKALIAYNNTGSSQSVKVSWGAQSFVYTLPTRTSATFTWSGSPSGGGATGAITGLAGKCVDVAGANSADGTQVQLYTCNGTGAQQWTRGTDGTLRALGKCLDVRGGSTADGARVQLYTCNGTGAQRWSYTSGHELVNPQANKCLDVTGNNSADGTRLQIWTCTGGANQKWTVP